MPALVVLLFVAFACCCLGQFWFLKKIKIALIDRHPETFLEIEKSALFPLNGLMKFTRGKKYKALEDDALNRLIRDQKRLTIVTFAVWLAYAAAIFILPK